MRIAIAFLLVFFLLLGCNRKQTDHRGKNLLVEVNGNFLYKEDLQAVLPLNLSQEDSLLFSEHFIRNWIEEVLLLEKAESNIPDDGRVDELVENYRKALVIHTYQQELTAQKLSKDIRNEELLDYYENNKMLFLVEAPLIKGLFMKVPLTASGIANVRSWYRKNSPDIIDKLEKYSLQNAVSYDYFYDKWVSAVDMFDRIPVSTDNLDEYLQKNSFVEARDTAFYYFLNVGEFLPAGAVEPYEYAAPKVREMVVNLKQTDFIRQVKGDLYQDALRKNRIKYNY